MNPSSDADPTPVGEIPATGGGIQVEGLPLNWREAFTSLIASRFALIQLESQDAAAAGIRRLSLVVAAVVCAAFAWALLLAGMIAALAQLIEFPWYWLAIAAGLLHLLAGIVLARRAKPSSAPAFPITRAEFQKDREWLNNFQDKSKSNS